MRIDGDWGNGDSVEDWLAIVQFEGVPKDKIARWRRSLGTVLKYARRIPSGVLRCVYVTVWIFVVQELQPAYCWGSQD